MRYRDMAKHYIYEWGVNQIPTHEDGKGLLIARDFTDAELQKFIEAFNKEVKTYHNRLVAEGVLA